ncbi:Tn3 family transposase [Cupriavidus sp. YAF13]|uniref:Tn3 family transposase n=1 Tax=Cupriavidus sp. YAF13 TaxID=3233075 RepID=UPI003F9135B7
MEPATVRRVSLTAIERGWDELLRLAASIRSGRVSASLALQRFGAAARCTGRRSISAGCCVVFLCNYIAIEEFGREIQTLLIRGESVRHLQRAIYYGKVSHERGRRRDEMKVISGSHALLTNIVLAWNTAQMQSRSATRMRSYNDPGRRRVGLRESEGTRSPCTQGAGRAKVELAADFQVSSSDVRRPS